MPAPMPCAVPVTSATRPVRSGMHQPSSINAANLLDARLPDPQDVLVRPLVERRRASRRRAARARRRGSSSRIVEMSAIGFGSCGSSTPGSRVHGKFSNQEACEASASISFDDRARRARRPTSCATAPARPVRARPPRLDRGAAAGRCRRARSRTGSAGSPGRRTSRAGRRAARGTSRRCSVGLPGYAAKYGVRPYGSDGSTSTPSGSAASTETRSDRIRSTPSDR